MKIKLDENLGSLGVELLQQRGHDVMTVRDQGLCGATDDRLFEIYADERRVLITLDRDLGEVLRFPPEIAAGTVILGLAPRATPQRILDRLADFLSVSETNDLTGQLWVVEPGRSDPYCPRLMWCDAGEGLTRAASPLRLPGR